MLGQCFLYRLHVVVSPFPLFLYTGTCERLSRSLSTMNSSDSLWSSAHYLVFRVGLPCCLRFRLRPTSVSGFPLTWLIIRMPSDAQGTHRVSQVLWRFSPHIPSSLLRQTLRDLTIFFFSGLFVLTSDKSTPSSSVSLRLRSCCGLKPMRFGLRSM
jgi:hypothetical protein